MKKIRADQLVKQKGLCASRAKAQQLIRGGQVEFCLATSPDHWQPLDKVAALYDPEEIHLRLSESSQLKYVSRGGLKLAAALEHWQVQPKNWRVLDVGISTGGFTDCLLQHGAQQVVGVDVGHEQLDAKLRAEPRLLHFEGVNARELTAHAELQAALKSSFALIVVDVSFISLSKIIPELMKVATSETILILLVKPQFELSRTALNKKGVVKTTQFQQEAVDKIIDVLKAIGLQVKPPFLCPVEGQSGNKEYFLYAKK